MFQALMKMRDETAVVELGFSRW